MISPSQIYEDTKQVKKESACDKVEENKGSTEDVDGNNEVIILEIKVSQPEIVSLIDDSD